MKIKIRFLILASVLLLSGCGKEKCNCPVNETKIENENQIKAVYINTELDSISKNDYENLGHCSKIEIEPEELEIEFENEIPFHEISNEERELICNIVAGEAIGESYICKKLVAQCIMNAMDINGYTPAQVRKEYRYDGYWPEARTLYPDAWKDVESAVSEVFDKGNVEVYDTIEYFYSTKYCTSKWHESLRFVIQEGSTRFFSKFEK